MICGFDFLHRTAVNGSIPYLSIFTTSTYTKQMRRTQTCQDHNAARSAVLAAVSWQLRPPPPAARQVHCPLARVEERGVTCNSSLVGELHKSPPSPAPVDSEPAEIIPTAHHN